MRALAFVMVVSCSLTAQAQLQETHVEKIGRLIKQLGDDKFAWREAASKELQDVGEPALSALREAAKSNGDPEIRRRADLIILGIGARLRAAAGLKELAKWEGAWEAGPGSTMTIKGDRFTSSAPSVAGPRNGTITVVEVGEKVMLVDMFIDEGDVKGQTFKAIFRLDGDTLHYCGTYAEARPVDFKSEGANYHIAWKRARK